MKSPNSEITETGRRKGRNKKNEGFMVKMDIFLFFSKNEKKIEIFFLLRKKTIEKVKKPIKFNCEIV